MHADVGYAPAMAMLSAYGFYDGQTRDDPGGRTAVKAGGQAEELLVTLKGVVLQELYCFRQQKKCVTLTILFEGHLQTSGWLRRRPAACGMVCADVQREVHAGLWCLVCGMCLGWAREAARVRFWAACHE